MDFVLSRNLLGADQHLQITLDPRRFQWVGVETQPSLNGATGQLDAILHLERRTAPSIPSAYLNAASCMGLDHRTVLWSKLLPPDRFREYVSSLLTTANDILNGRTWNYVVNTFQPQQKLLDSLGQATIDTTELHRLYQTATGDTSTLDSFSPDASGLTDHVQYNRFKTATGRLTVSNGPRILTLPKTSRGIIKSRWPSGRIAFVDYVSLEPRVALALAGGCPERDIYSQIERSLCLGLSRSTLKLAVLSILYGAGTKKISELTGLSKNEAYKLASRLKEFFCIKRITKEVTNTVVDGCMRNYFGRPIFADKSSPAVLYNHYVQSTAADAALLGFASLSDFLEQHSHECIPLFVIHDCIVLDCGPNFDIEKHYHVMEHIQEFENEFYVEVKYG